MPNNPKLPVPAADEPATKSKSATESTAPGGDQFYQDECPECGRTVNAPIGQELICPDCAW
jgi:hypothetical protein